MPGPSTTVMRLERQIREEHAQALIALRQAHERLVASVLAAARERGHLVSDPLQAVASLRADAPALLRVGRDAADLWLTFFSCFRTDEAAYEAKHFREQADALNRRLAALPPGTPPDGALTHDLLTALDELWEQRHEAISQRLDQLIADLGRHQSDLGTAQLGAATHSDELARAQAVVDAALGEIGESLEKSEQLAERLVRLLKRYRSMAQDGGRRADEMTEVFATFVTAIRQVAQRGQPPPLPPEAQAALAEVGKLDESRRALEDAARVLHQRIAGLEGDRRQLMEEVAAAQQRLDALAEDDSDPDARLTLYRQAVAAWESGQDPAPIVAAVRKLERVIPLAAKDQTQWVKVCDRHLSEGAKALVELRQVVELGPDPKRYRPRLFGSDYEFKTLPGMLAACRDAARDTAAYADRARWALGVAVLARHVPKLRAVFRELVGLVAQWREKLGDPPPASLSISLDASGGVLALPAIVAADLQQLLKRRKAAAAANDLLPIIDACTALYHASLAEALGEELTRAEADKREGTLAGVARLADELTALAARCDTTFREAAANGFRLDPADAALVADEHLLRRAVQNWDELARELAGLPNAPAQEFTALVNRKDPVRLHRCAGERAAWLELLARYRVIGD